MLRIGLTGGIGSGKSTVAALFEELGVPVLDADAKAFQLVQPGQPAFDAIIKRFGQGFQTPEGQLDRKQLRARIFEHPEDKHWLETLLHPEIKRSLEQESKQINQPYCIIDIPLLIETGPYTWLDRICVVDCPENTQIERVLARGGIQKSELEAILKTQASRRERLAIADDIIDNSGSLEYVGQQVNQLHELYLALSTQES